MNPSRVTYGADLPDSGGALPFRIIPCGGGAGPGHLHSLKKNMFGLAAQRCLL